MTKMLTSTIKIVLLLISLFYLVNASEEIDPHTHKSCSQGPNVDVNEIEDGFYLGSAQNSYISYTSTSKNFDLLNVSLELKTSQYNGMIFYAAGEKKDFYGLYLKDRDLQVSYHCDGYLNSYSVRVPVSDGKWHKLRFTSNSTRTELTIDENFYTGRTSGCKNPAALVSPFFFGSVDKFHFEMAKSHLENHNKAFVGCMKHFVIGPANNTLFTSGVAPCRKHAESGTAFGGSGSYALVDENMHIDTVFNLRMEIKSKTNDGILFFYKTQNGGDYLLLQLIEGYVKLTASKDDQPLSTTFNCSDKLNFCDGKWHSISVSKNKNVHILTVDGKTAPPILYFGPHYNYEGKGTLYLGGIPATYAGVGHQYVGCIKNLYINSKPEDFFTYKRAGNVTINVCT